MGTGKESEVISEGMAYMAVVVSFLGAFALPTFWLWVLVRAFKIEGAGFLNSLIAVVCCWVALLPLFYGVEGLDAFLKDPSLVKQKSWLIRSLISLAAFTAIIRFLLHTDYIRRALIFALIHIVALYFWIGVLYRFMEENGSFKVLKSV